MMSSKFVMLSEGSALLVLSSRIFFMTMERIFCSRSPVPVAHEAKTESYTSETNASASKLYEERGVEPKVNETEALDVVIGITVVTICMVACALDETERSGAFGWRFNRFGCVTCNV